MEDYPQNRWDKGNKLKQNDEAGKKIQKKGKFKMITEDCQGTFWGRKGDRSREANAVYKTLCP